LKDKIQIMIIIVKNFVQYLDVFVVNVVAVFCFCFCFNFCIVIGI